MWPSSATSQLGHAAGQLHDRARLVHGDAVVDVRDHLAAHQLEGLGRVERDDVVDVHRHDERRVRRLGVRYGKRGQQRHHPGQRAQQSLHCVPPDILR